MIVWSISSGLMPVASRAPRAATAPRSIAEISFSTPTYSPIGVRLPPSMKTSLLMFTSSVMNFRPNRNLADYHKPQRGTKDLRDLVWNVVIRRRLSEAALLLISESVLLDVAVEEFLEEALVGERGEVVGRSKLVKNRQRNSPRHPLSRHVRQIPATAQKSLHHLNLRVSQAVQVRGEIHRLERPAHRGIAHRRCKHLRELRRFRFAFTDNNRAPNH